MTGAPLARAIAELQPCATCEGSLSVGEPGFTYYGVPEPGSYEPCPDCMDDHGIPTGTRWVVTDRQLVRYEGVVDNAAGPTVWREVAS